MNTPEGKATFDNLAKSFSKNWNATQKSIFLSNNKFESSFQYYESERESSKIFKDELENPQTWAKLREFKINEKIDISSQKGRLSISRLIFQTQNGVKNV